MRNLCGSPIYKRLILLVCIWCQSWCIGLTQPFHFERIPSELGLSQNFISSLCQDSHGYLWVGTKDGLNRFDGYRFDVFEHDPFDSTSLSGSFIKAIHEDRSGRLWIGTSAGVNLFDRERVIFHRLQAPGNPFVPNQSIVYDYGGISSNQVTNIVEDQLGNIWVGTLDGGVTKIEMPPETYDLSLASFTVFSNTEVNEGLWEPQVISMAVDEQNNVWVHDFDEVAIIHHTDSTYIERLNWADHLPDIPGFYESNYVYNAGAGFRADRRFLHLIQGLDKSVWVLTAGAIGQWDISGNQFDWKHLDYDYDFSVISPFDGAAHASMFDEEGHLWVVGNHVVGHYQPENSKLGIQNYRFGLMGLIDIEQAGFSSLLQDQQGNIWMGSNGHGLYKHSPKSKQFSQGDSALVWRDKSVRTICQTSDGNLWIAPVQKELYKYHRPSGQIERLEFDQTPWERTFKREFDKVYDMAEDDAGDLWLGTEEGLCYFDLENGEIVDWSFREIRINPDFPATESVIELLFDEDGKLWLLTDQAFGQYDFEQGKFYAHSYLSATHYQRPTKISTCLVQNQDGNFWIGAEWGLLEYNPRSNEFQLYSSNIDDPYSLSHPVVKSLFVDKDPGSRVLWVGTGGGGLNRLDLRTRRFSAYKKQDGLPDNVVYGILDDEAGNLWLSTNQGLSRFDPETGMTKNYTTANGLQDQEFNTNAYFKSREGELFFGGIKGLNAFFPSSIVADDRASGIALTKFSLANEEINLRSERQLLTVPIDQTEAITLNWDDKVFSFEFASLDLTAPDLNQYAYMLEGFHDDWQYNGYRRNATFTNISPGDYVFKVKATNHDGIWNDQIVSLGLTILKPWWQQWWAYLLYILIIGGTIFTLLRFQFNLRLRNSEAKKLQELDRLKTRMYTDIAHEFRTPLTVIMGMTQELAHQDGQRIKKISSKKKAQTYQLIQDNSENLLQLINQLLDLSKLESGQLTINAKLADVIPYLRYLVQSFQSTAREKQIQLVFYAETDALEMDFDEEKLRHIVYNLVSNALKFTPKGGEVIIHVKHLKNTDEEQLQLRVKDNGPGIPENKINHIFDRYYQLEQDRQQAVGSSGIGLSITKQMTELLGGRVEVSSQLGQGTSFIVNLPIGRSAPEAAGTEKLTTRGSSKIHEPHKRDKLLESAAGGFNAEHQNTTQSTDPNKPLLLLVEDHADVRTYIGQLLSDTYRVVFAENGRLGLEKAADEIPDLIISDVMMPEMDGFSFTQQIKSGLSTCHIPVILLTAKATSAEKLEGLKTGADAYLVKPFQREELLVRVEQLLLLRKNLQVAYADRSLQLQASDLPSRPSADDQFLYQLQQAVLQNYAEADFDVDKLAGGFQLSRAQFYRKVKALLDKTPNNYIKEIRLSQAKILLKKPDMNVSEVAYAVGFSDPAYFSRVFQQAFGQSPKQFKFSS
ncbi:MAG: two-component regulator propeller domain-containing protein [Bacteroidota bacterium]